MQINITRLDNTVPIPKYANEGDAGVDLTSTIDTVVYPGERVLVPTGISIALPDSYVGLIHPRSGLAINKGISIVNAPGTIDSGYRGEIKVILINHDKYSPFKVQKGDRIAQLVIQRVEQVEFVEVNNLDETSRGVDGFGSTGV